MPRQKNAIPTVRLHLYLSEEVVAKLELLTLDPATGKASHKNTKSALVESLLRQYFTQLGEKKS